MRYTIVAKNIEKAAGDLDAMGYAALHPEPAFHKVMGLMVQSEKVLWARDGGGGRNHWPPNTKSTLATKVAQHLDKRPMRATGKLEDSLTELRNSNGVRTIGRDYMEFGTKLFYAQFAQFAKNPKRKRTVVKIMPKQRKGIRETILDHLTNKVGG